MTAGRSIDAQPYAALAVDIYAEKLRRAIADAAGRIELVKRSAQAKGFEVISRRWVVKRSRRDGVQRVAWIDRCRRLASIRLMLRTFSLIMAPFSFLIPALESVCYRVDSRRPLSGANAICRR